MSMKKSFSFFSRFAVIFFSVLFMFSLFSCSGLLQKESDSNGSVSFELPVEDILTQINSSRSIDSSRIAYCSYRMDISIIGNKYEVTKSTTITEADKKLSIRFDKIPVGKKVYAVAKIYEVVEKNGTKNENLVMYGKSETKKIKAGLTFLKLNIYNYLNDFQFTLTISFSDISSDELENVVNNLIISAVPADSNEGRAITEAGSDKYKLYETLSTPFSDSSQFYCNGHDEKLTISLDKSNKKLTVSGTMAIPVNEDAPGAKGKEIMLVASMYKNQNDSLKPKLFGKSQNIIPEKGKQFDAAITVKKLNVLDTPVVTYFTTNIRPEGITYHYTLDDKDYVSAKTGNFCFDQDGYFYALNYTTSNGREYTISTTNPSIENDLQICNSSYQLNLMCDTKTNILYSYYCYEGEITVYKYQDLISSGTVDNQPPIHFSSFLVTISGNTVSLTPTRCVIYDGMLYIIAFDSSSNNYGTFIFTVTFEENASVSTGKKLELPSGAITDMIYFEDSIYLLIRELINGIDGNTSWTENFNYYSRGALVKYKISDEEIKTIGWTEEPLNNSGKNVYGYHYNDPIYEDSEKTIPFKISSDKIVDVIYGGKTVAFPKFYVPENLNDNKHFFGPQKFIAIKPKKLVIADDGVAFYTESDNAYKMKNANRIVTVDLESFSLTSTCIDEEFDFKQSSSFSSSTFADKATLCEPGKTYYLPSNSEFTSGEVKAYIPLAQN